MAPRKSKRAANSNEKRVTKSEIEKLICKRKLDALEQEESQVNEDRFSSEEKRILLDAYIEQGYNVFQNIQLLHKYLPQRKESDLKSLVLRLRTSLLTEYREEPLDNWQKLCHQLLGNFAKDKKINLDEIVADALFNEADQLSLAAQANSAEKSGNLVMNQSNILKSFAQLSLGKFPDQMNAESAHVSIDLFRHIDEIVDSIDLNAALPTLCDGSWLESAWEEKRQRQELALKGIVELNKLAKKCPTYRDLTKNRFIEALCLELPKIKRIADVLNPLCIESLNSSLIDKLNL